MRSGDEDVHQALQAGAKGYLFKDAPWPEIAETIVVVHRGLKRVSGPAAAALAERVGAPALTDRERQVLDAMVRGQSNKEIAAELDISEATVKAHVTSILSKLDVTDRTQAVTTAIRRGIVHLPPT